MGGMVDPGIILAGQTPKPVDPLEAYGRVMALKSALGQQQLQQQPQPLSQQVTSTLQVLVMELAL